MITIKNDPTEDELLAHGVTGWLLWTKEVSRFD
jgi:hypothetical protein